jgi:hypothetical protein
MAASGDGMSSTPVVLTRNPGPSVTAWFRKRDRAASRARH